MSTTDHGESDETPSMATTGHAGASLEEVIGRRVRELRQELDMTTAELGDAANVSKAMVSKIENARTTPSLTTLDRLAGALSVPLTSLFRGLDEETEALYVPAGGGPKIVGHDPEPGHTYELLGSTRGSARRMEPMLVTLTSKTDEFPLFQHSGTEWIYMIKGEIEYAYGSARYKLSRGDVLQFDSQVPHGPISLVRLPAQFLLIKAFGPIPDSR